jgi:hypothetical protein
MTGGAEVLSNRGRAWDEWTLGLRHDAVAWLCIMAWLFAYRCLIAWSEFSTLPLEHSLRALRAMGTADTATCRRVEGFLR